MGKHPPAVEIGPESKSRKGHRARLKLLEAAMTLMGRPDAGPLNVSTLTDEAGIGRVSFYNYFPSIEALTGVLAGDVQRETEAMLAAVHGIEERGAARMAACLAVFFRRAAAEPVWGRFVARLLADSKAAQVQFRSAIQPEIDGAIRVGDFALKADEVETYLRIVIAGSAALLAEFARKGADLTRLAPAIAMFLKAAGMKAAAAEAVARMGAQALEGSRKGR